MRRFRNTIAKVSTIYAVVSMTEAEGGHVKSETISPLSPTPEHARKTAKRLKLGPRIKPLAIGGTTVTGVVGAKIGYYTKPVTAVFLSGKITQCYLLTDDTIHRVATSSKRKIFSS